MTSKKPQLLGHLELEIMKVVWEHEDLTVSEVSERLPRTRKLHHNTVMTTMNRLAQKGLLRRYARDGRTHGYTPKVSREEVREKYMKLVMEEFFDGSITETLVGFLGIEKQKSRALGRIHKSLDEIRKEEKS